ncbi:mitogen-activated kinase kinase 3 [Chlorella sorokiniana]|uniref:mitogen-activated protein kinase kinase n=1 Tax=Chlorella sorokiniana TaxID=3076 RepID=A0A2P6TSZ0_CHLSO|nr:mitogen-activated kinase kinase 3 [Chlorella sorokiniana]|eukprot:PRW57164.1 mitogen-activated kinase kinase 3 [Chlorella sorokiniana]
MPPKLFLNVNASVRESFAPAAAAAATAAAADDEREPTIAALHAPSIEIGPSGTLRLFKSFQAFEFNPLGMKRSGAETAPLASGAAALHSSYKISEHDVRIVRTLGSGASGVVQKAFLPRESRFVAIKKISVLERDKRHQLMNDIKALCNAPLMDGLIRFFGAYHAADRGQIAVVLEYMDGGSLADVVQKVERIPEPVLAGITARILPALAYMHSHRMVHRDIKPANILMSTDGQPKVSDFGISAFMDNTIAQCHTFLGTVTYMSPERINGQPYSFPADIWALGLTLLECATGKYPYDASGGTIQLMIQLMEEECPLPPEEEGQLSPELRDFVAQCMRRDPWARPTAEQLLQHPFVLQRGRPAPDLRAFMRGCMYNAAEKLEDAVAVLTSRYYNNLSYNYRDSDSIAAYYASDAVLTYCGEKLKGRYTIAKHFHGLMKQASALGDVVLTVEHLDHQLLAGETDTVLIQTRVLVVNEAPAGPGSDPETLGSFTDSICVRLASLDNMLPGSGFAIHSHMFRWHKPIVARTRGLLGTKQCRVQ